MTTSLDTNVIVRFLTDDDPVQSPRARDLIESTAVWVSRTALLETEWVLRGAYGIGRTDVIRMLRSFLGLPRVTMEDAAVVARGLSLASEGMDFADALHLAASHRSSRFATFDRGIQRRASRVRGLPEVVEP